jgi:hypothetical protein
MLLWLLPSLQDQELPLQKPALFAKCLQLLLYIAEPSLTCEPLFQLLQPSNEAYGQLIPQLGELLVQPMPGGAYVWQCVCCRAMCFVWGIAAQC